jgi:GNAT superfamily N-acetyltransferase
VAARPTSPSSSGCSPIAAHIRLGRTEETGALQQIEIASGELFRTVGMAAVADDDPAPARLFAEAAAAGRLWVAEDGPGRGPVGFALAILVDGRPHLEQLSVHPDHGRRGIGRALVATVAEWARSSGATELTLSTFRDVPWNGPYYARLGFAAIPDADLTAGLLAVRDEEAAHGLDVSRRELMRLPL